MKPVIIGDATLYCGAALLEGFRVIGIEREPEYFDIAVARCAHVSPEAFTVQPTPRKETAAAQGSLL